MVLVGEEDMEQLKGVIEEPNRQFHAEDEQTEVIRELRDLPPLHYLFQIKNLSYFNTKKVDSFPSSDFEIGGYKWRLCLYPNGNKKVNVKDHISLYLVLSKSNSLPLNREINVYFKLFVYDQIQDKYLTVQDAKGRVRRFRGMKKEWGFDQLIPLDVFNDASNGYLVDDCCVFGAEVFVLDGSTTKAECATLMELENNSYTWKIENFAGLTDETYTSEEFVIGGHLWTLEIDPDGFDKESGKSLSAFLNLEDAEDLDTGHSLFVVYTLRVRDQVDEKHHELTVGIEFDSDAVSSGCAKFIPLSKLNDKSKGYMSHGAVILEVEISLMTKMNEFS